MTQHAVTQHATAPVIPEQRRPSRPVNSWTEWDPLEEVVVGRLDGGVFPTWQDSMRHIMPTDALPLLKEHGGEAFPARELAAAQEELDGLADTLAGLGITVRRPDSAAHDRPFETPNWSIDGGLYAGMPRDCLMTVGDAIIEAPMSWRCRYHETEAFRSLIKRYFRVGARWVCAPKPTLTNELWADESEPWAVTDYEPVFDAADFMRFGADIIGQRSHVTNQFGIEWLQRELGPDVQVHVLEVNDPHAMHIDATIAPLAPGTMMVHPSRYVDSPLFRDWKLIPAPEPALPADWPMYFCSPWVSMNVLSLDPETVVVESHEQPMIDTLTAQGFRVVAVPFRHVYSFGGSFHCVTLDVRRDGGPAQVLHRAAA